MQGCEAPAHLSGLRGNAIRLNQLTQYDYLAAGN